MDARCAKHQFEGADNFCRQCGHPFCVRCLVFPFGERKPPYCIPCALAVAGVRSGKKLPKASRRERRAQRKAALQTPAAATVDTAPDEEVAPLPEPLEVQPVPDPSWSQPLSGDDPWFTSGDQASWMTPPAAAVEPQSPLPMRSGTQPVPGSPWQANEPTFG